ncbi:MAG: nucleoside phosphorylase [SAR324 cluster bacterium]|nr:nucleoside phosphorylase [SAR324 cluster bacterium]
MKSHSSASGNMNSAQEVRDSEGRQYHIATAPGEVADYVLLCGDPDRADRTAKKFERIEIENRYREYVTITGVYQGSRITVCATGIGCDNTEIAVVELSQCVKRPTFLRIGTCGALQDFIKIGDLVISTGAVRLEDTSLNYVPASYPAVAHYQMVQALEETTSEMNSRAHVGITATCSGFYGAQGRNVGGFRSRKPKLVEELQAINVYNLEMETSTLLTLSSIQNFRAGAVCVVFANRVEDQFISMDKKDETEDLLIETGLQTIIRLINWDRQKQ